MHITQAIKTDLQSDVSVDSQRYMVGKQFKMCINTAILKTTSS